MLTFYTDGSARPSNPGPGGWAWVMITDKYSWVHNGSGGWSTNNRMELFAVIDAVKYAKTLEENKIHIYSDSKYVINSYEKWLKGWVKRNKLDRPNGDLWKDLYNITRNVELTFTWVKGHSHNKYNEIVDKYAKLGCTK